MSEFFRSIRALIIPRRRGNCSPYGLPVMLVFKAGQPELVFEAFVARTYLDSADVGVQVTVCRCYSTHIIRTLSQYVQTIYLSSRLY